MFEYTKDEIKIFFAENKIKWLVVFFVLLIGLFAGIFTANYVSKGDVSTKTLLDNFIIANKTNTEINFFGIVLTTFFNNIYLYIALAIFGMFFVGIPFILVVIMLKGYFLGFSLAVLFNALGIKSIIPIVFGVLPSNIIIIFCYCMSSVFAINNGIYVFSTRNQPMTSKQRMDIMNPYFFSLMNILLIMLLGIILEAILQPFIFRIFI